MNNIDNLNFKSLINSSVNLIINNIDSNNQITSTTTTNLLELTHESNALLFSDNFINNINNINNAKNEKNNTVNGTENDNNAINSNNAKNGTENDNNATNDSVNEIENADDNYYQDTPSCPICFDDFFPNFKLESDTISDLNKTSNSKTKKPKMGDEFKELKNKIITLDCRHRFHYECIVDWFKQRKNKYSYSTSGKSIRVCPYCRNKSGFIELPENAFPIKYIHKEYSQIEHYLNLDDFDKLKVVCEPFLNKKYCSTVLKNGTSKGQQCRKYKSKDCDYCHIHQKKYESFLN